MKTLLIFLLMTMSSFSFAGSPASERCIIGKGIYSKIGNGVDKQWHRLNFTKANKEILKSKGYAIKHGDQYTLPLLNNGAEVQYAMRGWQYGNNIFSREYAYTHYKIHVGSWSALIDLDEDNCLSDGTCFDSDSLSNYLTVQEKVRDVLVELVPNCEEVL